MVVSDFGPPSLATAGTGDVLTGVVAAFLSKGVDAATAAAAAAVAHGLAATAAPTCRPGWSRATYTYCRQRSNADPIPDPASSRDNGRMERSCFTLDLGAIRRNAETLLRAAEGAELWAVVKAEGYGHGAVDVSRAALEAGATALCVATLLEALHLRAALRNARILVMGPVSNVSWRGAHGALGARRGGRADPEGVRVHLKIDTGMGRWGLSELPGSTRDVVGVMSHPASAESTPLSRNPGRALPGRDRGARLPTRHSPTAQRRCAAEARFDAVRCGIALYGISPFGTDPADDGLEPGPCAGVARRVGQEARAGREHGLRRRFVADRPT